MKVTLTTTGLDYIRQLMFDKLSESHIKTPPANFNRFSNVPVTLMNSTSMSSHFVKSKQSQSPPVLDILLPAVLAANPPKPVDIKQTRISISNDFKKRYVIKHNYSFSMQNSFTTNQAKPINTLDPAYQTAKTPFLTKKDFEPKNAKIRLLKTMAAFNFDKNTKNMSKAESLASQMLIKTLRYGRLLQQQEKLKKRRDDLERNHQNYIKRLRQEDADSLDSKTIRIQKFETLDAEKLLKKDTQKARYIYRLMKKHNSIAQSWWEKSTVKRLSCSPKRIPNTIFSKLEQRQNFPEFTATELSTKNSPSKY